MIYACQTKGCHYLFVGSQRQQACPDCGKPRIRPAKRDERAAYFRLRTEFAPIKSKPG